MSWVIDGLKGHWRSLEPPTCMIGCISALLALMRWWGQIHWRNLDRMLLKLYLSEAGSPLLIQQRDGSSPASAWWVCAGPPVGLCRPPASSSSGPSGPQRHLSWCWCSDLQESQGFMEASVPTRVGWSMTISHTCGGGAPYNPDQSATLTWAIRDWRLLEQTRPHYHSIKHLNGWFPLRIKANWLTSQEMSSQPRQHAGSIVRGLQRGAAVHLDLTWHTSD